MPLAMNLSIIKGLRPARRVCITAADRSSVPAMSQACHIARALRFPSSDEETCLMRLGLLQHKLVIFRLSNDWSIPIQTSDSPEGDLIGQTYTPEQDTSTPP